MANVKKGLKKVGKLDKHGKPNDNTPAEWLKIIQVGSSSKKSLAIPFSWILITINNV